MTTHPKATAYFDDLKPFLFYTVSVRIETSSGTGERNVSHFRTLSSGKYAVFDCVSSANVVIGFLCFCVVRAIYNAEGVWLVKCKLKGSVIFPLQCP